MAGKGKSTEADVCKTNDRRRNGWLHQILWDKKKKKMAMENYKYFVFNVYILSMNEKFWSFAN